MSPRPPAARSAAVVACCVATAALTAAMATPAAAHPARPRAARATSHAHAASHAHSAHAARSAHAVSSGHAAHAAAHAYASHAAARAHLHAAHLPATRLHAARGSSPHRDVTTRAASAASAMLPLIPVVPTIDLRLGAAPAAAPAAASAAAPAAVPTGDALVGRSGKLRARFVVATAAVAGAAKSLTAYFPYLRRLFGDSATTAPGVYAAPAVVGRPTFAFITMLPFSQKVAGRVGDYRMGFWPGETSGRVGGAYANPAGFIEVTADNQATYVSEHFRLADFLTHDQRDVWPKYLVLREPLLDKLELVLDDLRAHGYHADGLHVMSGFRTPQYNETGGDPSGRAERSRHQYGDAADVWVENGSGAMADLNGDGRIDARDAAVLAAAADRVEQAHPELVGGVGIYGGNGAHGPFVHIDTRGTRARWGHA